MSRLKAGARRVAQRVLGRVAGRYNYFLTQGLVSPSQRYDHSAFMSGTLWSVSTDVVRAAALELAARELEERGVPGAAAEVGVFQGDFAQLINHHLPSRTLYLFDTFEGFDPDDVAEEAEQGTSDIPHAFEHTSAELALSKLEHPERAVVKKGWFPGSAADLSGERFCFVSLDVDLYRPMAAALEWFYPRLSSGGYLFVHDYNNDQYRGVKKALRQFADASDMTYTLLPDAGGTAVVAKPPARA
jgi:O-methyltransferase